MTRLVRKSLAAGLAVAGMLYLSSSAAQAQADADTRPRIIQAPGEPAAGDYVDPHSGLHFPARVGDFQRFRAARGPTRYDVDAGYALVTPAIRISASVFVSLPPPYIPVALASCARIAEDRRQSLTSYADAVISPQAAAPPLAGFAGVEGRVFSGSFTSPGGTRMTTDTYIYCRVRDTWLVQYSFSHLAGGDTSGDTKAQQAAFLRDFTAMIPKTIP